MQASSKYNTDIDISSFKSVDQKILDEINDEFLKQYTELPETFNWGFIYSNDTEKILGKKLLIEKVKNQYLCGCCWAIAVATAISDAFVIRELVHWAPSVSYTYALAHYPQQKCSGGSSRVLLEEIKMGDGIASDYCVDESWCLNNKDCCSSAGEEHFSTLSSKKELLSSLIPKEGCYNGTKKHYIYKISDVYTLTTCNTMKALEAQIKIKQHILVRGPVVAGFLIMDNFPDGLFTRDSATKGIYFEKVDELIYEPAKDQVFSYEKNKILGSHSVVVMGWGTEKNVKIGDKTLHSVPYWWCRNSWGTNWGNGGYFKIAMYPYNKICQFSKRVRVIQNNIIKEVGGVTGFLVTEPPKLKYLQTNKAWYPNLLKKVELYNVDENIAQNIILSCSRGRNDFLLITALIAAAILFFSKII